MWRKMFETYALADRVLLPQPVRVRRPVYELKPFL
jgi:hypothetical protein